MSSLRIRIAVQQQQCLRRSSVEQRFILHCVRSVNEEIFGTGRMGDYTPIQMNGNAVQLGRVAWDLISRRLAAVVLLLDLTQGFVLDYG